MKRHRAIGIVRVSRLGKGAQSPEVQKRLIAPFVERQGWELIDLLDENEIRNGNVSGGADLSRRQGFGPAVERVRRGGASIIVAADLSRLFRDIDIQRRVIEQIESAGGEFWTVANGRVSHETADSELMANVQGSMNHYQRRYARDKSFLAVEIAIEQGKVPWSQTAPGYVRSADSRLRPDPKLRPVIERAFRMRLEGTTIAEVRAYLAQHGVRRSYHGTMHLLRDRVYVGEIHFGQHTPNLAAHEPIIAHDVFRAVQRIASPRGRKPKSERLLARLGVLMCSGCGGRMVVGTQTRGGRTYPFYRCGHVREDCASRQNISAELVEGEVVAWVKHHLAGLTGTATAASGVSEARAELDRAQAELEGAIRAFSALADEPAALARLDELREIRDGLRERLEELVQAESSLSVAVTIGDWDDFTPEERRDLIRATISRVVIRAGRGVDRIEIEAR